MVMSKKTPWFVRVLFPDVVIPVVTALIVGWMIYKAVCP